MAPLVNALVSTFSGLDNLCIPIPRSSSVSDLYNQLSFRLPIATSSRLILSTSSGHILSPTDSRSIDELASDVSLLSLRLTPTLVGGKGGFGSQLRAAGGRMSSKKKRNGEENNDSCRNLDGRRIRTVKEAKALAAYLEIKPEMERKEKERRKERWRKIIEQAEMREAEEEGRTAGGKRFEDVAWLEQTEEERERTRQAVLKAMEEGAFEKDTDGSSEDDDDMADAGPSNSSGAITPPTPKEKFDDKRVKIAGPKFADFDDDEFMSSDEEEEEEQVAEVEGKGKGKA